MSAQSIGAATRPSTATGQLRCRLRRLARGNEADPAWARPGLWLVGMLAGALSFWGLTRSGYANTYYAEAAQAASRSWSALLTNAIDASGSVSLDKGPLSNMLIGLSARLFGFSSFSILAPEALCGVGSVLLVHNTVRRVHGHRSALLAALMLALTPIFVAMSRFNNPDALLVLLEVAAAWALVRALQSGRTSQLVLSGLFIGLAFNTKMLQAYLVVPGFAFAFLLAGAGGVRRRLAQLLAAGAAMLAVSFAWYGTMMMLAAADRPWVGDTTDNSWFSLIFGANGLDRVSGASAGPGPGGGGFGGAGGFGGTASPLRLFNSIVGGQIAWLLPLALVGLALGLYSRRRAAREDLTRASYVLWGGWALVSWAVFSFSQGVFHPYYTTALAPAVAVLAAGAVVLLWDRARRFGAWAVALALSVAASAALAATLLGRGGGFAPFLGPLVIILALLACIGLALAWTPGALTGMRHRVAWWLAASAGAAALLAGPAAYSLQTVGKTLSGGNPLAGPTSAERASGAPFGPGRIRRAGGFPARRGPAGALGLPAGGPPPVGAGAPPVMAGTPLAFTGGFAQGPPHGVGFGRGGSVSAALVGYLKAHQGSARYIVAAVGSGTSAAIALQSGREAINMGGFMGSDPAPSLARLERLIASRQVRYVLLDSGAGAPFQAHGGRQTDERDAWVRAHGSVVEVPGAGQGLTLYRF
ncbi:MAG TPA: glycosyltransferase family 39 protein [Solirubrobacteraceae bacterium]